jgi:hypothetical protein
VFAKHAIELSVNELVEGVESRESSRVESSRLTR